MDSGKKTKSGSIARFLILCFQGAIVGTGAILPGVSGGVLLVAFGIYEPMMALLSHPAKAFPRYWRMFVPFLIGWVAGFVLLAKLVEKLFNASSSVALMLFAGLILGTVPKLMQDAQPRKDEKSGWTVFILVLAAFFLFFRLLGRDAGVQLEPNLFWYVFCGMVWGLSLVVPGLSSSSLLLFLGLYQPMTSGIAALDFTVILPLLLGIAATVLLTARLVNHLFEKRRGLMLRIVTGILLASTLLILPVEFTSPLSLVLSLACFAAGFVVARWMDGMRGDKSPDAARAEK